MNSWKFWRLHPIRQHSRLLIKIMKSMQLNYNCESRRAWVKGVNRNDCFIFMCTCRNENRFDVGARFVCVCVCLWKANVSFQFRNRMASIFDSKLYLLLDFYIHCFTQQPWVNVDPVTLISLNLLVLLFFICLVHFMQK